MSQPIQVLLVEDNPADADLLLRELRRAGFDPQWHRVETEADYLASLRPDLDLIFSDFEMPEFNGLRALELLKERGYEIPFIMVSGTIGEETAVAAIKRGAADYLMKDRLARIGTAIGHTLEQARLRRHGRQAEKALAESESKFRVLFDVAYDAIFIIHQGLFVDCNARALELFGLPRGQIIGQPVSLGSPPIQPDGGDPKEKARELLQAVEAGLPQSFEWLLTRPDGTKVYTDISLSRFEQGGKVYVQAIARDITERKRAEEVLRNVALRTSGLQRRKVFRELLIIFALSVLMFVTCYKLRLSDDSVQYIASHNEAAGTMLDEVIFTLVFFCLAMLVFSYRRWRESQKETLSQTHIAEAMGILRNEMEAQVRQRTAEIVEANKALQTEVSERKRAEESLTLFRSLIDRSNDAIEVIDPETGRFLDVNETACRRLGYSRKEMLSMNMPDVVDTGGSPLSLPAAVEGTRKAGSRIIESRHRRKDGSTFPVEINVQLVHLNRDYLLAVVRDITERKLAEDALHASESNMAAAQRLAHIGSWELGLSDLTDFDANPLHWSDEIFRIAGFEPGEVVPANELFFQLVPPREHGRIREAVAAAITRRQPYSITHRLIRPSGEERIVQELAEVIIDEKTDQPLKMIGTTQDITERKRSEEQIAEQAALLDKAQDAILVRDLEGNILFWNKGAERMYGWARQDVVGSNVDGLLYTSPKKFEEVNGLTISQGEWSGELRHLTKDRGEITIEARWTLIRDDEGRPKSVLAINTDITEKKKIEAQFMRAQRMESIGTLAGGVAHDLNNILAPIMMSIDILKLSVPDPQARIILETIEVSAQRGADIVRQVLSFARGLEGERVEVQPRHLLKDLECIIKDTFPKNIRLQFSIPNDTWTIWGDPTQVHQILLNLCVNARDAMPNGGSLTVGVENRVLDEQYAAMNLGTKPGRYVNISVTDSGTGIPPAIRDKIFDPFFTTKELNKGTGLGLSTVMAIVKSHEGSIDVYSEQGKGTTFNVCLPAMELSPDERKEHPEEISLPRGNGETVLVIDDEASILTITSQTLQAFGYRVLTATDGADAVAVYAQHTKEITVVLIDMMMPVMDGPAAIHALMRLSPAIKIIAASGLNANESVAKAAGAGVKHFLTKPYTAATLLNTLRAILVEA
jgi:PAS domain S-box-containing protein